MVYQRKRKNSACTNCRKAHQKCDYIEGSVPLICKRCNEKNLICERNKRKKNKPRTPSREKKRITKPNDVRKRVSAMVTNHPAAAAIHISKFNEQDVKRFSAYLGMFAAKLEDQVHDMTKERESKKEIMNAKGIIKELLEAFTEDKQDIEEKLSNYIYQQKQNLMKEHLDIPDFTVILLLQYIQLNLMFNVLYYEYADKKKIEELEKSFQEPFLTLSLIDEYLKTQGSDKYQHKFFYNAVQSYFYFLMDTKELNEIIVTSPTKKKFETPKELNKMAIEYANRASDIVLYHQFSLSSQVLQLGYTILIRVYENYGSMDELTSIQKSLKFLFKNNENMKLLRRLEDQIQSLSNYHMHDD